MRGWARTAIAIYLTGALAAAAFLLGLPQPASAGMLTNFTWSGATPNATGASNWSAGTNWAGGIAPSGAVGTLTFPALTASACTASPPTDTCYQGNDDVGGLSANAIALNGGPYAIQGQTSNPLTLGAGGLTANGGSADWGVPVTLSTSQTWSFVGSAGITDRANITGSSKALSLDLPSQSSIDFVDDVEVGAISATGGGQLQLGPFGGFSLNGTDGNPVRISGGTTLWSRGFNTIGPLTVSGGDLQIGFTFNPTGASAGLLSVNGSVALDSGSELLMYINHAGSATGDDFTQLSATGDVSLGGAQLFVGGDSDASCPVLKVGDAYPLVTTKGSLSGTFAGIPDGTVVPLTCTGRTTATLRINYTANSVLATVESVSVPTSASVSVDPTDPVTNETVTLQATASAGFVTPAGTVEFDADRAPIPGCTATTASSSGTFTCRTSFAASASPVTVTATFTPAAGSPYAGSTSSPVEVTVGKDSTTTGLSVSSKMPGTGQAVTYTATVTPSNSGDTKPSGAVAFLDGGTPIGSCSGQPLSSSGSATCTVTYGDAGTHSISAHYQGDGNFNESSSPSKTVTASALTGGQLPPPSGSARPTTAHIKATLRAVLRPGEEAALLKTGGYTRKFDALAPGTLRVFLYALGPDNKKVLIASVKISFSKAGRHKVRVKLTAAGEQLLRTAHGIRLFGTATFIRSHRRPIKVHKTFT